MTERIELIEDKANNLQLFAATGQIILEFGLPTASGTANWRAGEGQLRVYMGQNIVKTRQLLGQIIMLATSPTCTLNRAPGELDQSQDAVDIVPKRHTD